MPKPPAKSKPLELTPELIDRICFHVLKHNFIHVACRMEGVSDKLFASWMEQAAEAPSSLFGTLKQRIEQAEADAESRGLNQINELADGGLASAIMWRQERRYSGSWGKKEGAAGGQGGNGGGAPVVQIILPPNGRETPVPIDIKSSVALPPPKKKED